MDTVALRGPGLAPDKAPASPPEAARLLTVTATYVLSEDGRKASLLAGGNGRAVQELSIDVPANRLHLVSVDDQGVARLKLQPRYDRDGEQSIVRIDTPPTYDNRRPSKTCTAKPREITSWSARTTSSAPRLARNDATRIASSSRRCS